MVLMLLRRVLERWQYVRLRRFPLHVRVAASTRLLRNFSVRFMAGTQGRLYLSIGERCLVNGSVTFESRDGMVEIGDRTYVGSGTSIMSRSSVRIGNDVTMAWGVTIYDHDSHSFEWRQRAKMVDHFYRTYGSAACFSGIDWEGVQAAPIVIADRVWIGFDAVILKGVTIGEGAVVAARSVVTRDVEPYTVVAGVPARVVRRLAAVGAQ
jgi:acetyltransferase-like isoleucine patch superfamily enzyme